MARRYSDRSRCRIIVTACLLLLIIGKRIPGFSQPSEYLLKAVFLEKFTRFIDWPDAVHPADSTGLFIIGILGEDPFDVDLETVYKNQKIKNRPVRVRNCQQIHEVDDCDLLFISQSEKDRIPEIISSVEGKPILTVSDSDEFSGKGVIINMFVTNNKVRFEIDEQAIQRAGFHVSYLLLKEAKIVNCH